MKKLKLDIQKFGSASAQSDSYEGRYLRVTFTETGTSIQNNTSTVQWTLESTGGSSSYYTICNCRVTATYAKNSGTSTVTENVCDYGTVYWNEYRFPAKTGSVSGTITVKHKDDGTALPVNFTLHGRVFWDGDDNRSSSLNLTTIPRYATANQSFNSKTETTIKMNWSSDNTCDYIWYSTNNGSSWTAVGSVNSTNGSYTISGLSANTTYQIKTKVRRKDSQLTTESSKLDVTTYDYPKLDTNGGPDFYIESPVTLTIYNPRGHNCTVIVYDKNGNEIGSTTTSGTTAGPFLNDNTSTLRMYSSIPNNPEGRYSVKVNITGHTGSSISGGLYKANKSLCEPTFTDYRLRDVDEDTRLLTGDNTVQIVGYSDMAAIIPAEDRAEPKHGASMSYYRFIIGNSSPEDVQYSYDRDVSAILNNAPAGTCKVYAYDSRGFDKLVEKTPQTVLYYTDITRGPISIVRQNGNIGEAVTLTFSGTFWNEDFGAVHNAVTSSDITYQFKKTTDSSWTPGQSTIIPTTTQGSNTYSFSGSILGDTNNGFDTRYSYNIEITVSDKLSSTTFSTTLGSGSPGLAVHDSGIAVKQPYDTTDDSVLQVNGKANIKGNTVVSGNIQGASFNSYEIDLQTNNTADTWVPVMINNVLQHRVIPKMYNTSTPAIKMECIDGRISNANIAHTYENNKAHVQLLQSSSSMTSNKPAGDGYILHFSWDNNGPWNGQLFLPEEKSKPMQYRPCENGTWGSWEDVYRVKTLYTNASGTTGSITLSESCANFTLIEVFYLSTSDQGTGYAQNSSRVWQPNGKSVIMLTGYCNTPDFNIKISSAQFSGTSVTRPYGSWEFNDGFRSATNFVGITKIVGYR